jgi:hypothetical protein
MGAAICANVVRIIPVAIQAAIARVIAAYSRAILEV